MAKSTDKQLSKYATSRANLVVDSFNTPIEDREHLYMPVALAHVYFPRRDVKLDPTESYVHKSGHFQLDISQLPVRNHNTGRNEFLGLPFGPKSRLLLGAINTLALKQGSNKIDIEADTLPQFLGKIGITDGGNQLRQARNQIARLSASLISVSYQEDDGSMVQGQMPIVKGFDIFPRTDPNQLLLWKRHIVLSLDYWEELQKHPLPLSLEHMRILSGNARAIDFYCFLAYRLHSLKKPLFLTWSVMKEIFGGDIDRMDNFKAKMRQTATLVKLAYSDAKFSYNGEGWTFEQSPSPIQKKHYLFHQKQLPKAP